MHSDYTTDTRSDSARAYSAQYETNSLFDAGYTHDEVDYSRGHFSLADKNIVEIVRLRLLTDAGFPFWDVSYCHGRHADGTLVPVRLEKGQFGKRTYRREIVELCQRAGRYGKDLGIFDAISTMR